MATNEAITYTVALDATKFNADLELARKNVSSLGDALVSAGKLTGAIDSDFQDLKKGVAATASAMSQLGVQSKETAAGLARVGQDADKANASIANVGTQVETLGRKQKTAATATKEHGGILEKLGGRDSAIAEKGMRTLGQAFGGTSSKASEFIGLIGDSAELLAGGAFTIGLGVAAAGLSKLYDAYQEAEYAAGTFNRSLEASSEVNLARITSGSIAAADKVEKLSLALRNLGKTEQQINERDTGEALGRALATSNGLAESAKKNASQIENDRRRLAVVSQLASSSARAEAEQLQVRISIYDENNKRMQAASKEAATLQTQLGKLVIQGDEYEKGLKRIAAQSKAEQEAITKRTKALEDQRKMTEALTKSVNDLADASLIRSENRASKMGAMGDVDVARSMKQAMAGRSEDFTSNSESGSQRKDVKYALAQEKKAEDIADKREKAVKAKVIKNAEEEKDRKLQIERDYQAQKSALIMGGVGLAIGASQTIVQTLIDGDKYALETIAASIATNVGQFVVGEGTKAIAAGIAQNAVLPGSGAPAIAAGTGLVALGVGIGGVGYGLGADVASKKADDDKRDAKKEKAKRDKEKGVNSGNKGRKGIGGASGGGITLVQNFGVGGPTSDDNARYLAVAARVAARRGNPWMGGG